MPNRNFGEHLDFDVNHVFSTPQPIPASEFLAAFMTLGNDGSTFNMNVNGAIEPKLFQYVVPAGKSFHLSRMIWEIQDGPMDFRYWFGKGSALSNGCSIKVLDEVGGVTRQDFETDVTGSGPLKRMIDFGHLAGQDLVILQSPLNPTAPDVMIIRWSLFKSGYTPVLLGGEVLQFEVNDDLSDMDVFRLTIQGRLFDE